MSLKVAVIVGSTRPGRAGKNIAEWYMNHTNDVSGMKFELIDLEKEGLPFLDEPVPASAQQYQHEHTKKWSEKISGFDAYIFVTAEYNHSIPAPLKNAIDYLYNEWANKPVAFVGYGGAGGTRAIVHLRTIAGELQMADIRLTIGVRNPWEIQDSNIAPELVSGDPKAQLEQLRWWGEALKTARET